MKFVYIAIIANIIFAATEPLIPALFKSLIDKGFGADRVQIWTVPVFVIGIFIFRGIAQFIGQYALTRITNDGIQNLRDFQFERLTKAHFKIFNDHSGSALSNAMVYEIQSGSQQIVRALNDLLRDGLTLVALLGYLFWLNWQLTLLMMTVVPALAFVVKRLSVRLYRLSRESQLATDDLAYVIEENVLAQKIIRLHSEQRNQFTRFVLLGKKLHRLALKSTIASASVTPLTQVIAAVALSIVMVIALLQAREGHSGATVGGFIAFIAGVLMLISPARKLTDVAAPITRGLAGLERGLDLLDGIPEEAGGTHAAPRARGHLVWDQATVLYEGEDTAAIAAITLEVFQGETVALVGSSGSGKTTLVNTLPRFVDLSSGTVRLDGVDVAEWTLPSLRAQIAMVSQDVVMLNTSVADNVALGQTPEPARVQACLEAANLWEHVRQLPQGMDSLIGHNASQFSGGQRQRLAIARALYKDAPLLILDEATSALDNESERLVQEALQRLMQGRTTLIVAHRLSTIEHADRVVVMERGRIIEQGRPAELLAAGGAYARLHQGGEFSSPTPRA